MPRIVSLLILAVLVAGCTLPSPPSRPTPYYAEVLGGAPWTDLVIEVDHAPGRMPGEQALTHLRMTFANLTGKTSVRVLVQESLPTEPATWTAEKLVALEAETRTTRHAPPTAVLHVLYPAGAYERPGVAGVTIAGPVIGPAVVFLDTLREYPVGIGGTALPALPLPEATVRVVERATLLHEAGHAVGLVDNSLPMVCPHEDAEHEGHSSNPESVMYWMVETMEGIKKSLTGNGKVPDVFDLNDLRDIQAGGGRGAPAPASC